MAWAPAFLAALARPAATVRLSARRIVQTWGPGSGISSATSTPTGGGVAGIGSGVPLALSSQTVSVPSWTTSRGSLRIGLGSQTAGEWAAQGMPRGALVELRATVTGSPVSQTIYRGQVRDLAGIGPQSVLSSWDLLAAVLTRTYWFAGLDSGALFYHCTPDSIKTRTLAMAWTPGDSTLACNTTTDFGRQTGTEGAVLITPSSGADPFLVTFTGQTGSTVLGVSDAHGWGPSSSVAGIGSTVQEVAWMVGHPLEVARRILVSTGAGTNGPWDVYPAAWGYGVPEDFIDLVGFTTWTSLTDPATGTHRVRIVSTVDQPAGGQWLEGVLARYGMWLTMWQGQITGRACLEDTAPAPPIVLHLDGSRILRGNPQRSTYHSGSALEYARTVTRYGTVSPTEVASTLTTPETVPAQAEFLTDYGDELYQNQAAIAARLNARIGAWVEAVPHAVDLVCTLEAAQLAPGDWVTVRHPGLWTPSRGGDNPLRAMVGDLSVDWSAGAVTLRLYLIPTPGVVV